MKYKFQLTSIDFEVASSTIESSGKFAIAMSPVLRFGLRVSKEVLGRGLDGKNISFTFLKDGLLWGGHTPRIAKSIEFFSDRDMLGQDIKAWIASRAWFLTRREVEIKGPCWGTPLPESNDEVMALLLKRRRWFKKGMWKQHGWPDLLVVENEAIGLL
jgi:hypothetical protein